MPSNSAEAKTRSKKSGEKKSGEKMKSGSDEGQKKMQKSSEGVKKSQEPTAEAVPSDEKYDHKLAMGFVERTLARGVTDIVKEFRDQKKDTDWSKMKTFKDQNTTGRNRYKDVGCLDKNRVEITTTNQKYIHANYVAGNENPKRFICTQGPLAKTTADFWYMVVQEKTPVIVMLCNFKEQNMNKCAEYFPPSITKCVQVEDIKVFCLHVGRYRFRNQTKVMIVRSILEVVTPDRRPHRLTHLHWRDWPDRGVPGVDLAPIEICEFLTNVQNTWRYPIVVHCSAGIGRTGCLVLIDLLLEQLRNNVTWETELLPALNVLRSQRANSVQTEHQYLYVHQVMLNYVINHLMGKKDKELLEKFAQFSADYEKYVTAVKT